MPPTSIPSPHSTTERKACTTAAIPGDRIAAPPPAPPINDVHSLFRFTTVAFQCLQYTKTPHVQHAVQSLVVLPSCEKSDPYEFALRVWAVVETTQHCLNVPIFASRRCSNRCCLSSSKKSSPAQIGSVVQGLPLSSGKKSANCFITHKEKYNPVTVDLAVHESYSETTKKYDRQASW